MSQERPLPAYKHLHPPDHLPDFRSIFSSAESALSLHHSLGIHNTSLPPDGSEREKYGGEVFRSTDEK